MTRYLNEYREFIKRLLDSNEECDYERLIEYHEKQIEFFQHERLIHLIVTALFAILFLCLVIVEIFKPSLGITILALILLIMNIAYIKHYYFLENQVQALYQDFNKLYEKQYGITYK